MDYQIRRKSGSSILKIATNGVPETRGYRLLRPAVAVVRSGLCGGCGLLCCFSVSAMAQWCGSTLVTDDSCLFTLSVDLRL